MAKKIETERNREERRKQIADVAIKLFLKKGIAGTSMRDLADALNITSGGIYHFFNSKDDVISVVVKRGLGNFHELLDFHKSLGNVKPTKALCECIKFWLLQAERKQYGIIFLTRESLVIDRVYLRELTQTIKDCIQFFENLLRDGVEAGEFQVADPHLLAFNIWALSHEWALRRWLLKDWFTVEEYAEKQLEAVMKQIRVVSK
ncbi:MAG: TetR/AcrR family transcriptional regulator [Dehalococcoidales bacterium]|nr:TetR/AcrR family transcriptional regulator [Dehalococcoidales bacterium]